MSDPYTIQDYRDAMVQARRERDEADSRAMDYCITVHEYLDSLARALGIQTGRESWWEATEEEQRAKVLERVKELRKVR